jgi:hypothetical protein
MQDLQYSKKWLTQRVSRISFMAILFSWRLGGSNAVFG